MYKKTTLPNGLRLITVNSANTDTVTVLTLVGTGSKYETKEISGISHFLEHLQFKGTKKRLTEMAVFSEIDGLGGVANAFTSQEMTGYYAKVQSKKFEAAFDLVADIFLNSTLPAPRDRKRTGHDYRRVEYVLRPSDALYLDGLEWRALRRSAGRMGYRRHD